MSSRQRGLPALYVFSQTGEFWQPGYGVVGEMDWQDDRWAGRADRGGDRSLFSFTHIYQTYDGSWTMQQFWDFWAMPELVFENDYRKVLIPAESVDLSFGFDYGTLPCDFGDSFADLTSRVSCSNCEIYAHHGGYDGDLTYEWVDDDYTLTDETPYNLTVVLSDNTILWQTAPTEMELAEKAPFLRPGSWQDYCQNMNVIR